MEMSAWKGLIYVLPATPIFSSLFVYFCKYLLRTCCEEDSEPPNELSTIQSHSSSMPPIQRNETTHRSPPRSMTRNQHDELEGTTTIPVHSPSSIQSHSDAMNSFSSDPPPPYPGRDTSG